MKKMRDIIQPDKEYNIYMIIIAMEKSLIKKSLKLKQQSFLTC